MVQPNSKTRILRFFWGLFPWLIVVLILLFIIDLWGRIKEEKVQLAEAKKAAMKREIPAVRVITLTLSPLRLEDKINLPAEVEPYENLWVKAEVSGRVVDVLVKEGQTLEKGQILVTLDDRDYRMQLESIEANYKLARLEYERMATLAKRNIAAATDLDKIEAQRDNLAAQRDGAALALSRTRIRAPIDGRLNEIAAKIGERVTPGASVAQILQFSKVKVIVGVPESDVAAVFELGEATVVIDALGKRRVQGKKVFLSRQPRSLARLYNLELMVPNPDGSILPGMFARVELVKKVFDQALAIPLYAVITQGDERFVYVERNGKAEKRVIETGILSGWQVQVKSGLKAGEKVIVVGHRLLDDGQAVEVIKNVHTPEEILES